MPYSKATPKYQRILLKLSGEALGDGGVGIDPRVLDRTALEIGQLVGIGVQVGLVIGGGNLFRGAALHAAGLDRVTGDHMGMLATVMNALAMRDALERANIQTDVMSSIPMSGVVEHYDRRIAIRHLTAGNVVIFSAGTGNPFFTTDTDIFLIGFLAQEIDEQGARLDHRGDASSVDIKFDRDCFVIHAGCPFATSARLISVAASPSLYAAEPC